MIFKPIFHTLWGIAAGIKLLRSGILAAVPRDVCTPLQWRMVQLLRMVETKATPHSAAHAFAVLGPSFIKFGQFLATRADVVGVAMAADLAMLQDEMPPFPMDVARAQVLAEMGKPVEEIFSEFSTPVAAASIAQVHKAVLISNGKTVAVKLLRPDIQRRFKADLAHMAFGARMMEAMSAEARRLKMRDIVATFASWARTEMDLRLEASALAEMAQTTKNEVHFRVPHVEWDYTSRAMLTMEWIDGQTLRNPAALHAAGHDLVKLSEILLQSFLKQALNDGFFHADWHAGNIFVEGLHKCHPERSEGSPADRAPFQGDPSAMPQDDTLNVQSTIVAIDFGIVGRLGEKERRFFAEILWGFIKRDYERIAQVHFDAGYVPATQDKAAFAQALRAVGEPIHERPANEVSMARVITLLFEITSLFGMETRMELLLLQKSMVMAEGLARGLNPNINIWTTAEPIVKTWIENELGPKAQAKHVAKAVASLVRHLPHLDVMIENLAKPASVQIIAPPHRNYTSHVLMAILGALLAALALH